MKILQVVPSLDAAQGGIRTSVPAANRAIRAAGFEVDCVCVGAPQPPIASFPVQAFVPSWPRMTRASKEMRRWVRAHTRDYDAVLAHTLWLSPTRYAIDAALDAGKRVLLMPHGMLDPDALEHHAWRKRLRWWLGEGRRVAACTLVFSTAADQARAQSGPHARGLPAVVVANPVDASWFDLPSQPAGPAPRVLCLNRWHPRKGVLEFVQAMALLHAQGRKFRAELAGNVEDPDYGARVNQAARPLIEAGCLKLHGLCSQAEVAKLMAGADILVHPAIGYENFGNVLAEAAAAGVAPVGSPRALVVPEMQQAGAAVACEPEPGAMAAALGALLDDPGARAGLVARAREYALAHFTQQQVTQQWRLALRVTTQIG